MRIALILALVFSAPASGKPPADDSAATASADAEAQRQRQQMRKRAEKNAWAGVERAYVELAALGVAMTAADHLLGAEAARSEGDIWRAYQRLVQALQLDDSQQEAHDAMRTYRDNFGRLTVRRVEASAISFAKVDAPFTPDERAAVAFAAGRLTETGGFDGLVPAGAYTLGSQTVEVVAGLQPLMVQRQLGDGE